MSYHLAIKGMDWLLQHGCLSKILKLKVQQERVYIVWFLLYTVPEQERLIWWGKIVTVVASGGSGGDRLGKRNEGTLWGDGNVSYPERSLVCLGAWICQNSVAVLKIYIFHCM